MVLSATENRILDNKEIAKLQPKKTRKELLKVPVIPPVNVELMCKVFLRLRHCGRRYCNVTLQSLLRPLESKASMAALGTSGLTLSPLYRNRIQRRSLEPTETALPHHVLGKSLYCTQER